MQGRILFIALVISAAVGCEDVQIRFGEATAPAIKPAGPACLTEVHPDTSYYGVRYVDLPVELRKQNYKGGSCYHASFGNCLTQQGFHEAALDYWDSFAHGASTSTVATNAEKKGFRYAYTTNGDPDFLRWCADTRRWAAITYKPNHAINFVGLENNGQTVVLLDNNKTKHYERVPAGEFFRRWKGYGGGGITVVYDPMPPQPLARN